MKPPARPVALGLAVALASAADAQTAPATRPAPAETAAFGRALAEAKPGDVVLTAFDKVDPLPTPTLAITPTPGAAALAFSDRPEYFRAGDGIASQDTVGPGRVRWYAYHVPVLKDGKPRRILTIVENPGDADAHVTFAARSEPPADGDYHRVAKRGLADLLNGVGAGQTLTVPAHGRVVWEGDGEPIDKPDLLVHALIEFTTDRPLRLTLAQVTATDDRDADADTALTLPKLPMLPYGPAKDKSGRGVFPCADFDVALDRPFDTAGGPAAVIVANGKSDPWLAGVDGLTGDATTDKGNYGVLYHMTLKWRSTDGRGLAVLLTGLRYERDQCGFLTATVRVNDGKNKGGVIGLPRDAIRFHGLPEACVIQTFAPPADGGEGTVELTFSPPGACCLPAPILLVPIDR